MRKTIFALSLIFIITAMGLAIIPQNVSANHSILHILQELQEQTSKLQGRVNALAAILFAAKPEDVGKPADTGKPADVGKPAPAPAPATPATPAQPAPPTPDSSVSEESKPEIEKVKEQIKSVEDKILELEKQIDRQIPPQTKPAEPPAPPKIFAAPELTRSLSRGASGDDVKKLQEFLAQDKSIYPEGLATGYFGPLTEAAVKRLQEKHGIETVGIVGPKTRGLLAHLAVLVNAKQNPRIDFLSPSSGPLGTIITIIGDKFTKDSNDILIHGKTVASRVPSQEGISITFTIPEDIGCKAPAACPIQVSNKHGISDAAPFWVTANSLTEPTDPPSIKRIAPHRGPVDTVVTIFGAKFTPTNNVVNWGGENGISIIDLDSPDGTILYFTVPREGCTVSEQCAISVTNTNGTSNTVFFTLTAGKSKIKDSKPSPSGVKIITPNGGERYVAGRDKIKISWTGGTEKVWLLVYTGYEGIIDQSTRSYYNYIPLSVIAQDLEPSGTFEWDGTACYRYIYNSSDTICKTVGPGFFRVMAVSQNRRNEPLTWESVFSDETTNSDESDHDFMLITANTMDALDVLSPDGEERWMSTDYNVEYDPLKGYDYHIGTYAPFAWRNAGYAVVDSSSWLTRGQLLSINLLNDGKYAGAIWKGYWPYWSWEQSSFTELLAGIPAGSDYRIEVVFHGPDGDVKDVSENPFSIGIVKDVVKVTGPLVDRFTKTSISLPNLPYGVIFGGGGVVHPGFRSDGSRLYSLSAYSLYAFNYLSFSFGMNSDDSSLGAQKALYSSHRRVSMLPISLNKKSDGGLEVIAEMLDLNPEPIRFPVINSRADIKIEAWPATYLKVETDQNITVLIEYAADKIVQTYDQDAYALPLNYDSEIKLSVIDGAGNTHKLPSILPGTIGFEYLNLYATLKFRNGEASLVIPPAIRVISPNGREKWTIGTTQTISWKYVNAPEGAQRPEVELYLGWPITLKKFIAKTSNENYDWTIPADAAGSRWPMWQMFVGKKRPGAVSGSYYSYDIFDFSDSQFSIVSP